MIKSIYNLYMIIFYLKLTKNMSLKLNKKTNTNPIRKDEIKRNAKYEIYFEVNDCFKNFYLVSLKIANLICFYLIYILKKTKILT